MRRPIGRGREDDVFEAGFIFWGLLLVLALIIVGYGLWMRWAERSGAGTAGIGPDPSDTASAVDPPPGARPDSPASEERGA